MKSASHLAEDHAIVRREMTVDPFLEELFKLRKISCAPGSLRQDLSGDMPLVTRPNAKISKISAVNIGDAVVYQEPGKEQTVLGGVTAIIAQPTRKGGITLALKVHRLYQFQELREIFDNLAMYRDNPKLKDVDFRKVGENDPLVHDVEYQAAKRLYDQMEANVAQCFAGFPGLHHKVLVTALSDWTTTIAPEMVHEVLHLTLNSKVLENIGPSPDSEWPEKNADAIRMLSGVTVLWTSFLNTKTWTLHPVNLPPEAMTGRVLSAAARSMYWSPQGAVWGMVGTFRRYIDGRLKALGRHCSNQRQAVLSVPCSFNLFAFLVIATRNEALEELHVGDLDMQWLPDQRAWRAQFAGPEILETQLGPNWGSWSTAEGRFIKVAGPVVMKYSHKTPDKVQFIMLRVELGRRAVSLWPWSQGKTKPQQKTTRFNHLFSVAMPLPSSPRAPPPTPAGLSLPHPRQWAVVQRRRRRRPGRRAEVGAPVAQCSPLPPPGSLTPPRPPVGLSLPPPIGLSLHLFYIVRVATL